MDGQLQVRPNQLWGFHALIEITIDSFSHVRSQLFEAVSLCVNSKAKGGGGVASVNLIFFHFENDFAHVGKVQFRFSDAIMLSSTCGERCSVFFNELVIYS